MAPRIVTTGSSWVEPAGPVVSKIITCSATENQCAQVYPTALWFFKNTKATKDPMVHYDMLKRGMARTIYQQPILGGTLQQDERGAYSVEIPPAPRAGVRFHYRDLRNDSSFPTFQELAAGNYPVIDTKHDGLGALVTDEFPSSQHGDACFVAQFIVVRGGTLLTGSWTHLIGDLIQPRACAVSWAEQTKLLWEAQAAGLPEPALPTPYPDALFDRTRLLPKVDELLEFEDIKKVCDRRGDMFVFDPTNPEETAALMQNVFPPAYLKDNEKANEDALRIENGGMMRLSLKSLQKLQAVAQAGAKQKLSVVNVVIGLLWQRFYVAKYALEGQSGDALKAAAAQLTVPAIIFPGDVRTRLNPPLPQGYLGAAVDLFKATVEKQTDFVPHNGSTAELSRSLGAASSAVRDGANVWSEESYMELLTLFMSTPVSVPFLPKGPLEFLVTDHTRNAPMRLADWGTGMGVSTNYRQPYTGRDMPQGEVTVMPRHANGDIEVMITAERVTLQRMFRDPVLLEFAEPLYYGHNVMEATAAKRAAEYTTTARL